VGGGTYSLIDIYISIIKLNVFESICCIFTYILVREVENNEAVDEDDAAEVIIINKYKIINNL